MRLSAPDCSGSNTRTSSDAGNASGGKLARIGALACAASLVPTTFAAHRFWECDDADERAVQQIQFLKNLSLLGGLLIAAADTGGRPSIPWRAGHAAGRAL